jgi:hypothetical protein
MQRQVPFAVAVDLLCNMPVSRLELSDEIKEKLLRKKAFFRAKK